VEFPSPQQYLALMLLAVEGISTILSLKKMHFSSNRQADIKIPLYVPSRTKEAAFDPEYLPKYVVRSRRLD
jgi:hypothetical protein